MNYNIIKINADDLLTSTTEELEGKSNSFYIYPNPGTDRLIIKSETRGSRLVLYDMNGHVVFDAILKSKVISIDTKHLSSGVYIYKIF